MEWVKIEESVILLFRQVQASDEYCTSLEPPDTPVWRQ